MYGCVLEVSASDRSVRPWKRALEADHRRAAGVGARELDRVLDRLGARVEEGGLRRAVEGGQREQALGELGVDLVGDDSEVGVGEALELLLRRLDHLRMGVADVQAADAAREVDERVAVDVGDRGAARLRGHDRKGERKGRRDARRQPVEHLARAWPRNRRPSIRSSAGGCHLNPSLAQSPAIDLAYTASDQ